jgi:hypothetical protein
MNLAAVSLAGGRAMLGRMRRLRAGLVRVVGGWLVCQVALLAVPPVVLCVGLPQDVAVTVCTCSHTDGRPCPMHPTAPVSKRSCSCRGASEPGAAAMAALLGPAAVLPTAFRVIASVRHAGVVRPSVSLLSDWILIPDGPPPRA